MTRRILTLTMAMMIAATPLLADKIVVQINETTGLLITADGPITVERVPIQSIGSTPIDPVDPTDPNQTLAAFVNAAVKSEVSQYRNRGRDGLRISHAYSEIVRLIDDGTITTSQQANDTLKEAVNGVLSFSLAGTKWAKWRDTMNAKLNSMGLQNLAEVKAAYVQIATGLSDDQITAFLATEEGAAFEGPVSAEDVLSSPAFGDGAFLKFFREVILPLILQLIAGLG